MDLLIRCGRPDCPQTWSYASGWSGRDRECPRCATSLHWPSSLDEAVAAAVQLGRYRILERTQNTHSGWELSATEEGSGRHVLVRLFPEQLAGDPACCELFQREATAAIQIFHPHIVSVLDFGECLGRPAAVLQPPGPECLARRFGPASRLPSELALKLLAQAAQAVEHASNDQVIHGNIEPAHLWITEGETLKVDYLTASRIEVLAGRRHGEGMSLGLSPEQAWTSGTPDIRSDLYALGAAFYYLVTGCIPWEASAGESPGARGPRSWGPSRPVETCGTHIQPPLARVLDRMVAAEPLNRYQSAGSLLAALREGETGGRDTRVAVPDRLELAEAKPAHDAVAPVAARAAEDAAIPAAVLPDRLELAEAKPAHDAVAPMPARAADDQAHLVPDGREKAGQIPPADRGDKVGSQGRGHAPERHRPLLTRLLRFARSPLGYAFSVGLHVLLLLLLLRVQVNWSRDESEDLVLQAKIVREERVKGPDPAAKIPGESSEVPLIEVDEPRLEDIPETEEEIELSLQDSPPELRETVRARASMEEMSLADLASRLDSPPLPDRSPDWPSEEREGPPGMASFGLRRNALTRARAANAGGGGLATESAVEAGLAFLARHQLADGHWSSAPDGEFEKGSEGRYDIAITGLALLTFQGAGHTETTGKYQENVRKSVQYLIQAQAEDGSWMQKGMMYGHGICALAMSEAFGLSGAQSEARVAAQAGIDFIARIQGSHGGISYHGAGRDTSVTGWQIIACKSASAAGLAVPAETLARFEMYLDDMVDPATGVTGYNFRGQGSPAMTSVGLACRLFLGQSRNNELIGKIAERISQAGPTPDEYHLYYGTLGLFQFGGPKWEKWNRQFAIPLVRKQVSKGRLKGSWEPLQSAYGKDAGRVYVTAMHILCLEVYYRYLPVYR